MNAQRPWCCRWRTLRAGHVDVRKEDLDPELDDAGVGDLPAIRASAPGIAVR